MFLSGRFPPQLLTCWQRFYTYFVEEMAESGCTFNYHVLLQTIVFDQMKSDFFAFNILVCFFVLFFGQSFAISGRFLNIQEVPPNTPFLLTVGRVSGVSISPLSGKWRRCLTRHSTLRRRKRQNSRAAAGFSFQFNLSKKSVSSAFCPILYSSKYFQQKTRFQVYKTLVIPGGSSKSFL